jgi:hypothetical protein
LAWFSVVCFHPTRPLLPRHTQGLSEWSRWLGFRVFRVQGAQALAAQKGTGPLAILKQVAIIFKQRKNCLSDWHPYCAVGRSQLSMLWSSQFQNDYGRDLCWETRIKQETWLSARSRNKIQLEPFWLRTPRTLLWRWNPFKHFQTIPLLYYVFNTVWKSLPLSCELSTSLQRGWFSNRLWKLAVIWKLPSGYVKIAMENHHF